MNRNINKREQALILVLVIALLATIYYEFIWKNVEQAKVTYDTADLETEMTQQLAIAANIKNMEAEIEANKENKTGEISTYNNLTNEINQLNDIFGSAQNFSFGFDQTVADGDAVRRNISCSFTDTDYKTAKQRLQALHDCPYRCLITNLAISPTTIEGMEGDEKNIADGPVAVSLNVTFYETLYNATTTEGLDIETTESTDSTSLTDELAADKERAESTGE